MVLRKYILLLWSVVFSTAAMAQVATGPSGLSSSLTSANIFVGSASNVATGTAVTGDGSVSNTGVWTNTAAASNFAVGGFETVSGTSVPTLSNGQAAIYSLGTTVGAVFVGKGATNDATLSNNALTGYFQANDDGSLALHPNTGKLIVLNNLTTDSALTDRTLCQTTGDLGIHFGSGTLGICVGTSSRRFKHDIAALSVGIRQIMSLDPVSYKLNADHGDPSKTYYGFIAEDAINSLPLLVEKDNQGRPNTFDYLGVVPVLVKAAQTEQYEILILFALLLVSLGLNLRALKDRSR